MSENKIMTQVGVQTLKYVHVKIKIKKIGVSDKLIILKKFLYRVFQKDATKIFVNISGCKYLRKLWDVNFFH